MENKATRAIGRRSFLQYSGAAAAALWAGPAVAVPLSPESEPFGWETLVARAQALAKADPAAPRAVPEALAKLTYDQHRDIRFRQTEALWTDSNQPFRAQFFHPGWQYRHPVDIFAVRDGQARRILFDPGLFSYGKTQVPGRLTAGLGFAGFRLHYPLNQPDYRDELIAFLGASYFRALGKGNQYGLSARGIAIDTAETGGEEFPAFRRFWLEEPDAGSKMMRVYALLDGRSVAGAYRFTIVPGRNTVVAVRAALFFRRKVRRLGVAPLTSMFLHGGTTAPQVPDFRPAVHDSDGLSVETSAGEWIWRPLGNPGRLRQSLFMGANPRGFGLLQRNRDFATYQDLEAAYHKRPSVWVEPSKPFGEGAVHLIEIPSKREIHDNVVAFWSPARTPEAGERLDLDYRLNWCALPDEAPLLGTVAATRSGAGGVAGDPKFEHRRKFVIDFTGGDLAGLDEKHAPKASVTAAKGKIFNTIVSRNTSVAGWRVIFDVEASGSQPIELRCLLTRGGKPLTETWSYQWQA
jgi:glucans biosynthesis protein